MIHLEQKPAIARPLEPGIRGGIARDRRTARSRPDSTQAGREARRREGGESKGQVLRRAHHRFRPRARRQWSAAR